MARVLLLAARDLTTWNGRVQVLHTIIGSLAAGGHEVVCAVLGGPPQPPAVPGTVAVHRLPDVPPSRVVTGRSARRRGLRSLNERLYWSPQVRDAVRELTDREDVDLVVADGVRVAAYAEDSGRPWFVDLDDLLSARYDLWKDRRVDLAQLLGHRRPTSRLVAGALRRVPAARLLSGEAVRLAAREAELARSASGVSLVSPAEAAQLAERAGRRVRCLPMAVTADVHRVWSPAAAPDRRLAFCGSLSVYANQEAVRWWVDDLHPALARHGLGSWRLHVFGQVPPDVRAWASVPSVELHGPLPRAELHRQLVGFPAVLAPQREALGLTVKVVEAMVLGLVVLTTPQGASGLGVTDGDQLLLFSGAAELVGQVGRLERWTTDRPGELAALAGRGRAWAEREFGPDVLARRWAEVVAELVPGAVRSAARPAVGAQW